MWFSKTGQVVVIALYEMQNHNHFAASETSSKLARKSWFGLVSFGFPR